MFPRVLGFEEDQSQELIRPALYQPGYFSDVLSKQAGLEGNWVCTFHSYSHQLLHQISEIILDEKIRR